MLHARYIVFDDAPQGRGHGWTADQIANALRAPLAAIGVRVVGQHGARSNSSMAGFQARGCSRSQYRAKLNTVDELVGGIMTQSIAAEFFDSDQLNQCNAPAPELQTPASR
jgi:hypothetical protein